MFFLYPQAIFVHIYEYETRRYSLQVFSCFVFLFIYFFFLDPILYRREFVAIRIAQLYKVFGVFVYSKCNIYIHLRVTST